MGLDTRDETYKGFNDASVVLEKAAKWMALPFLETVV